MPSKKDKHEMTNEEKLALFEKLLADGVLEIPKDKDGNEKNGFYADELTPSDKFQTRALESVNAGAYSKDNQIVNVDLVTKKFFKLTPKENGGGVYIRKQRKSEEDKDFKDNNRVVIRTNWEELEKNGVHIPQRLTEFDKAVMNAVTTLKVVDGRDKISAEMVYKKLSGKNGSGLSPRLVKEIRESMRRLIYMPLRITIPGRIYGVDQAIIRDTHVIDGEIGSLEINGKLNKVVLKVRSEPVLYEFAKQMNQIGRPSIAMYQTPVRNSAANIALKGYLINRIEEARGKKRRLIRNKSTQAGNAYEEIILWDTVFEELEIKAKSDSSLRNKKSKVKKSAIDMLEYWKEQQEIFDFELVKHGPKDYSIHIFL